MPGKRFHSVFIAICITGMLFPMRAPAADLSIAPGSAADVIKEKNSVRQARAEKPRRAEKRRKGRIVTYSLFNKDPVFHLAGAVAGTTQQKARDLGGFRVEPRYATLQPSGASNAAPVLKLAEPESAGLEFGCERVAGANPVRRSMTACYRFQPDRGWRTQTYVSKEFTESGSDWGGGLSVSYAH